MPTTSTPAGVLQQVSVTLSSAQLLAIFTTPVTLVPAQGANTLVMPIFITAEYLPGGTQYTDGGGSLTANSDAMTLSLGATAGWWSSASKRIITSAAGGYTATGGAFTGNQAMTIHNNTANPTLGNGTALVVCQYVVVQLS